MKSSKSNSNKKVFLYIVFGVIFAGLVGGNAYQYQQNRDLNADANKTTEQKNQAIVDEVNKVFDVPDEPPVVAVVRDPAEFKAEYTAYNSVEVKEGDYLLFFRKARLSLLYRQSEKKVVKTADVLVPIAIELIGSKEALDRFEPQLSQFGAQITVTRTEQSGVSASFIYDVDQDQENDVAQLADVLSLDRSEVLTSSFSPGSQTEVVIAISDAESAPPAASQQETTEETDSAE